MRYSAAPSVLDCTDDAELAWAAIEPFWDDAELSPVKRLQAFLETLTEGQRALLAIDWCQKEVRNGGYRQLFGNSAGNLVPWAIPGFRRIGAERYADNMERAAALLGPAYPETISARKAALRTMDGAAREEIETLSDLFLDLVLAKESDLERFRAAHVRDNPGQFIRP